MTTTQTGKRAKGEKFSEKYKVDSTQIYKCRPEQDNLRIPPLGHPLHDPSAPTVFSENMVREMDQSTKNNTVTSAVEVWTDPDTGVLWVIDGRDRLITAREVNRRRHSEKREPIMVQIVPFPGDEKEAVARIAVKNNLRRAPTPSSQAIYIKMLRDKGWPWEEVVQKLNVTSDNPEVWCRQRLPLAYCEKEVRDAFDTREFPLTMASQFGGRAPDGSGALGKKQQLELLQRRRDERAQPKSKAKAVTPAIRRRVVSAIESVDARGLTHRDQEAVKVLAAALRYVDGDTKALADWPDIQKLVCAAETKVKEK